METKQKLLTRRYKKKNLDFNPSEIGQYPLSLK